MKPVCEKAVIAQCPDFEKLAGEGWKKVPGTKDFYILITN
jgi:hypothetical protein